MGVRILEGAYDGNSHGAALVCSTSMTAFGPLMNDGEEAEAFIGWLSEDARRYSEHELLEQYKTFRGART